MLKKFCKTCAIADQQQKVCRLNGMPIDPNKDSCTKHTEEFTLCNMCGSPIIGGSYVEVIEDKVFQYCERCNAAIGTCATCKTAMDCKFETDTSCPLPKVVMKTVRQGNMMMQVQAKNEERIKVVCPSCNCWDEENGDCLREFAVGCNKFCRRES
jgi:hypothetical protein